MTQQSLPSNEEMVMMYNLRSLLKHKLRKSIEEMKDVLQGQPRQEERVEVEIDFSEGEFDRDFQLTPEHYFKAKAVKFQAD